MPLRVRIDVVQVGGLLDPINVALIERSLVDAGREGTQLVLIQLDSASATTGRAAVARLVASIKASSVAVAVWVGPAGAGRAEREPYALYAAADARGMAPGTHIGREVSADPTGSGPGRRLLGTEQAQAEHLVDVVSPTLPDFIGQLDGRTLKGEAITTAASRSPYRLRGDLDIHFRKPGLVDRTLHALGSPSATWFLLVAGLLLVLFEFFSAGVGLAAGAGAVCLALSAYGVGTLGVRPVGVGLLLLATVGFGIDIQAGSPRFWTGVGTVALTAASLTIFAEGSAGRRPGWLALLLVTIGGLLFVLFAIPSTVRTRFSTPTIGRGDLVGATGTALTAVDPDGTVEVRGAPWRARTFPKAIALGDAIEVVAIEGLVLEVVPAGTELEPSRADKKAAHLAARGDRRRPPPPSPGAEA